MLFFLKLVTSDEEYNLNKQNYINIYRDEDNEFDLSKHYTKWINITNVAISYSIF